MKILIVEDEQHLAEGLRFNLEAEGYDAVVANDGETALRAISDADLDAVVLDVMLPGISGFDVAKTLRERQDYTPILMLTARDRPEDVLQGFEAGADDYLPKPFDLEIFLARLNGLLRRQKWSRQPDAKISDVVEINGRTVDLGNLELRHGGEAIPITLMEAKLLRYLIENEGSVVSRKAILEDVWQLQEDTDTRAIDNFIVRLRRYLENSPNEPKIVLTVRGVGYKYIAP
ncbi:MAG: response regulator transcription factor [Pyrinomonadaceae bacterium]